MVNDTIADYLTKIRNAIQANKNEVVVSNSVILSAISQILKEEGYIEDMSKEGNNLTLTLKYVNKKPAIRFLERVSKPGVRTYMSYQDIPKVINGLGINIFSTSKGIMTGKKARMNKIGGEYLCNIW
jgi:small subunit ribosomal protein S8